MQRRLELTIVPNLMDCPARQGHCEDVGSRACDRLSQVGHYVQELTSLGLWPLWPLTEKTKLTALTNILENFEDYGLEIGNRSYNTFCGHQPTNLKHSLISSIERIIDQQHGLCLACVKQGRVTRAEGNCQAREKRNCSGSLPS